MTFQGYLDTIRQKTGLGPADFARLAADKGLVGDNLTAGAVVGWLAEDYGLGRGHAMAIFATLKPTRAQDKSDDPVGAYFGGAKAAWRPAFDELLARVGEFGAVGIAPTNSYLGLVKGTAKFAIVAATGDRLDIGLKLKGVEPTERFEAAGSWNSMVTHRVRITDATEIDTQVLNWLKDAYDAA